MPIEIGRYKKLNDKHNYYGETVVLILNILNTLSSILYDKKMLNMVISTTLCYYKCKMMDR
jgi:hypothetical protein